MTARAFNFSDWFKASYAPNVPCTTTQARGPLLASSNDEPEPEEQFSESALLAADVARMNKVERTDDAAAALDWRVRDVADYRGQR